MAVSVNTKILCARPVPALRAGNRIVPPAESTPLPAECVLVCGDAIGNGVFLAPPFEEIPVFPLSAVYPGQIIGVVIAPDWQTVETARAKIEQYRDTTVSAESRLAWTDEDEVPDENTGADEDHQLAEGIYNTEVQLHRLDAPLWVEARPELGRMTLRIPTQWPGHVRHSVAQALGLDPHRVDIRIVPVEGGRDGALYLPSLLGVLAALCAVQLDSVVRLALRNDQMALTGGRSPSTVRYVTRLRPDGSIAEHAVEVRIECGAYPTLVKETRRRLRSAAEAIYATGKMRFSARALRTVNNPVNAFEGVGSAQVTFAREVHCNRLAGLAGEDPITWRMDLFRPDWPVLPSLATTLAESAEFHRRYAANELVRKRRLQLPRDTTALKGIGCAFGEQISGMVAERERGYVAVRLEQDGTARLYCSVPTPTPRLRLAWRAIVARELQIPRDGVVLDTACRSDQYDSGPRIFSRGSSVIPRAILSACEMIQKQRFREPLPIQVRRAVRATRATRNPADAQRSLGAAAVEATIIPATMEIDVRSVTIVVYAGRIMDRQAVETELRRGIYQALSWTLHETVDRNTREPSRGPELLGDPTVQRHYNPGFLVAPPRIKVVMLPSGKREAPVGIGELPFLTVPAALISALSQASGLYLDSIPTRPREILRMLQDEE